MGISFRNQLENKYGHDMKIGLFQDDKSFCDLEGIRLRPFK